jgi:hypothetical protein
MKRISTLCLAIALTTAGLGCCGGPFGGGYYGGGYPQQYNPACPGGNCGVGYGYAPQASAVQPYGAQMTVPTAAPAPVAAAPVPYYYSPYPTTALNHLPSY